MENYAQTIQRSEKVHYQHSGASNMGYGINTRKTKCRLAESKESEGTNMRGKHLRLASALADIQENYDTSIIGITRY